MRAARIGWLLVILVVVGGYFLGRQRKLLGLKKRRSSVNVGAPRGAADAELPSDMGNIPSLPRNLE